MKKKYVKASVTVTIFDNESIITLSSVSCLNYGGEKGQGNSESFNSMFGEN